jgi:integrase
LANLVALYTGFRPEEVYYLTKKDIDMNNRRISINPKKNWQPKTYEARTNPMSNNGYH